VACIRAAVGGRSKTRALIAVAVQVEGRRLERIRLQRIPDPSAASVVPFVQAAAEPGSVIHTDGWLGYEPLRRQGYTHQITFLQGQRESASQLMPHVHQVVLLLKRWLLGTHHGAVTHELSRLLPDRPDLGPQHLGVISDEVNSHIRNSSLRKEKKRLRLPV
jgi:hypothetical protein